jgi:hypothetical protein
VRAGAACLAPAAECVQPCIGFKNHRSGAAVELLSAGARACGHATSTQHHHLQYRLRGAAAASHTRFVSAPMPGPCRAQPAGAECVLVCTHRPTLPTVHETGTTSCRWRQLHRHLTHSAASLLAGCRLAAGRLAAAAARCCLWRSSPGAALRGQRRQVWHARALGAVGAGGGGAATTGACGAVLGPAEQCAQQVAAPCTTHHTPPARGQHTHTHTHACTHARARTHTHTHTHTPQNTRTHTHAHLKFSP